MSKFRKKLKRAFTLVELVVVIAIIAILTTVSVVTYFGVTTSAKKSVLTEEATSLRKELQALSATSGVNDYKDISWSQENGFLFTDVNKISASTDIDKLKYYLNDDGLKGTIEEYANNTDNKIKEVIYSSQDFDQIAIIDVTDWSINYTAKPNSDDPLPAQLKNIKDYADGTLIKSQGYYMGGNFGTSNYAYVSSGHNNFRLTGLSSSDFEGFIENETIVEFEGTVQKIDSLNNYGNPNKYPTYTIAVTKISKIDNSSSIESPIVYKLNKNNPLEITEDLINSKVEVEDAKVVSFDSASKVSSRIKSASKKNKTINFTVGNSDKVYYLYTTGSDIKDTDYEYLYNLKIGDRFSFSSFVTIYHETFEFQHICSIQSYLEKANTVSVKASKDIAIVGETISLSATLDPITSTDYVSFKFENTISDTIASISENELTINSLPEGGSLTITAEVSPTSGATPYETQPTIIPFKLTVKETAETGDTVNFNYKINNGSNNGNLTNSNITVKLDKNTGTTSFKHYSQYNETRVYYNNKISISHPTLNIASVYFDYDIDSGAYIQFNGEKIDKSITGNFENCEFIISSSGNGGHIKLHQISVTLCERPIKYIEEINLSVNKTNLIVGNEIELQTETKPLNAVGTVEYSIESATNSIEFNENSKTIKAINTGTATLKATCGSITSNILEFIVTDSFTPTQDSYTIDFSKASLGKDGDIIFDLTTKNNNKYATSITSDFVDITFDKGSASSEPGYISSSSTTSSNSIRFYKGNKISLINKANKKIKRLEIVIDYNSKSELSNIKREDGISYKEKDDNTLIINSEFNELTLNIINGQLHIKNITIYYENIFKTVTWDNTESEKGSITNVAVNGTTINSGDEINKNSILEITVSPEANYVVENITANGQTLKINSDRKYELELTTIDDSKITLSATFKKDPNITYNLSWDKSDLYYFSITYNNEETCDSDSKTSLQIKSGIVKISEILLDDDYELISVKVNNNILEFNDDCYSFELIEDSKITIEVRSTKVIPVELMEIDKPTTNSIDVGSTLKLSATVLPEEANQSVTWTSSNTDVATVDENGIVTGLKAGTTTITATTIGLDSESNSIKDTIEITVNEKSQSELMEETKCEFTKTLNRSYGSTGQNIPESISSEKGNFLISDIPSNNTGQYFGYDETKTSSGVKFGSNKKIVNSLTLTYEKEVTNVSSIKIEYSGTLTFKVTIGGKTLTKSSNNDCLYESDEPLSGTVVIQITNSAKAFYIKSITFNPANN